MAFDSQNVAWKDNTLSINGQIISRVTRVEEIVQSDVEEVRGAGDDVQDVVSGNKSYAVRVTLKKGVIDAMNRAAALVKPGGDLTDVPWTIASTYKATALDPKQTITFPNGRCPGYTAAIEGNSKSVDVELEFKCIRPVRS